MSLSTFLEVLKKLYYLKWDSCEKMEDEVAELMKRLIAWKWNRWVEMMLLMDNPILAKTFEIHEKVVPKSAHYFTISADGTCELTPVAREGERIYGSCWSQEKMGCQKNLQL